MAVHEHIHKLVDILMPALTPTADSMRSQSMPIHFEEDGIARTATWESNPMRRMPGLPAATQEVAARALEHMQVRSFKFSKFQPSFQALHNVEYPYTGLHYGWSQRK